MVEYDLVSRRRAIKLAGAAGIAGLAGCSGGESSGSNDGGGDEQTTKSDGTATAAKSKEFTFKVAHWLPPDHIVIEEGMNVFLEETKKQLEGTDYDVKFDIYPGGQLGGGGEMLRMAKDKTADLTLVSPTYLKGKLGMTGVGALPAQFKTGVESSLALFEMTREGGILFEEDYKPEGVKPLYISNINPYQLCGVGDKIVTLDDFKGRKIRTPGGIQTESVEALGGTTVSMEASDMVSAMERGTVGGTVSPIGSIKGHGWQETFEWGTTNVNIGGFPFSFTMNLETYSDLPTEVQDAFVAGGRKGSRSGGKVYDDVANSFVEQEDGKSMDFYEIPSDVLKDWSGALNPIVEDWVKNIESKGKPAGKALETYRKLVEKYP